MENDNKQPPRTGRGFAGMDREKQKEISSKGGRAAHAKGTAHEFTADEARNAGRKGGQAVSQDRAHMAQIGREGGKSRGNVRRAQKQTPAATGATPTQGASTAPMQTPPTPAESSEPATFPQARKSGPQKQNMAAMPSPPARASGQN